MLLGLPHGHTHSLHTRIVRRVSSQARSWRLFVEAFTARDIAEPLRSFDAETASAVARLALEQAGVGVAGGWEKW